MKFYPRLVSTFWNGKITSGVGVGGMINLVCVTNLQSQISEYEKHKLKHLSYLIHDIIIFWITIKCLIDSFWKSPDPSVLLFCLFYLQEWNLLNPSDLKHFQYEKILMISILHFICTSPCLCLLLVKHGCIWLWGNILNTKRKEKKIYFSNKKFGKFKIWNPSELLEQNLLIL